MDDKSKNRPFEELWTTIKQQELEPLSVEDGYRWGLTHLQYVMKELQKLESRALAKHDMVFFNDVRASMIRALEAETHLKNKLNS